MKMEKKPYLAVEQPSIATIRSPVTSPAARTNRPSPHIGSRYNQEERRHLLPLTRDRQRDEATSALPIRILGRQRPCQS
jgi:hypothetical protein